MASRLYAAEVDGYRGLGSIFEFVNGDGTLCQWNCGQAAAATYLAHSGALKATGNEAAAPEIEPGLHPEQPTVGARVGKGAVAVVDLLAEEAAPGGAVIALAFGIGGGQREPARQA